ncbi:MAG: hypothetical protein WBF33_10785, partial [Candidatus Nitrosopolaris sp.]
IASLRNSRLGIRTVYEQIKLGKLQSRLQSPDSPAQGPSRAVCIAGKRYLIGSEGIGVILLRSGQPVTCKLTTNDGASSSRKDNHNRRNRTLKDSHRKHTGCSRSFPTRAIK